MKLPLIIIVLLGAGLVLAATLYWSGRQLQDSDQITVEGSAAVAHSPALPQTDFDPAEAAAAAQDQAQSDGLDEVGVPIRSAAAASFMKRFAAAPADQRKQLAADFIKDGLFSNTAIDPETGDELVFITNDALAAGGRAVVELNGSTNNQNSDESAPTLPSTFEDLDFETVQALLASAIDIVKQDSGVAGAFDWVSSIKNNDVKQDATQVLIGNLLEDYSANETSQLFQQYFQWPEQNATIIVNNKAARLEAQAAAQQ